MHETGSTHGTGARLWGCGTHACICPAAPNVTELVALSTATRAHNIRGPARNFRRLRRALNTPSFNLSPAPRTRALARARVHPGPHTRPCTHGWSGKCIALAHFTTISACRQAREGRMALLLYSFRCACARQSDPESECSAASFAGPSSARMAATILSSISSRIPRALFTLPRSSDVTTTTPSTRPAMVRAIRQWLATPTVCHIRYATGMHAHRGI